MDSELTRAAAQAAERVVQLGPHIGLRTSVRRLEAAGLQLVPASSRSPGYRLVPSSDWVFPASDVRRCYYDACGRPVLEVSALALDGHQSPLPWYWLQAAAAEDATGQRVRDFLIWLNGPVYAALTAAWQASDGGDEEQGAAWRRALSSLRVEDASVEPWAVPGAPDLFTAGQPTVSGVCALAQRITGVPVAQVRDRQPQRHSLDQPPEPLGTGAGLSLDGGICLGGQAIVAGGRITVDLGRVTAAWAARLGPSGKVGHALGYWLRRYVGPHFRLAAKVTIAPGGREAFCLGRDQADLGVGTWLGERCERDTEIGLRF